MNPEVFGRTVAAAIKEAIEPLQRRLDALDRANGKAFIPSHRAGKSYDKGALVSCDGSYWQAVTATNAMPGGSGWAKLLSHDAVGFYSERA